MTVRRRNQKGEISKKRSDTLLGTIEKKYDIDFEVRSDMKLGIFLKKQGFPSLSKLLKTNREKK